MRGARGKMLDRVVRALGSDTDVVERIAALPAGGLWALLLEVAGRRAAARRPADVLPRYEHEATARFAIDAVGADGSRVNVCDGGLTDWTARLLADAEERVLISGVGPTGCSVSADRRRRPRAAILAPAAACAPQANVVVSANG